MSQKIPQKNLPSIPEMPNYDPSLILLWISKAETIKSEKEFLKYGESEQISIDSFIETFPNDSTVLTYKENNCDLNKASLLFHMAQVQSSLPVAVLFDKEGLTTSFLLQTLREHITSPNSKLSAPALSTALKIRFPSQSIDARRLKQVNIDIQNPDDEKARNDLMDTILKHAQ